MGTTSEEQLFDVAKQLISEIESAKAHARIFRDLLAALSNPEISLHRYHDFIELTIKAHFESFVGAATRLTDRDRRSSTLLWFERQLREYSPVGNEDSLYPEIISAYRKRTHHEEDWSGLIAKNDKSITLLRTIRNKWVSHRKRMSRDEIREFWTSNALAFSEGQQLLNDFKVFLDVAMYTYFPDRWLFVMIAADEETEEVLEALLGAERKA